MHSSKLDYLKKYTSSSKSKSSIGRQSSNPLPKKLKIFKNITIVDDDNYIPPPKIGNTELVMEDALEEEMDEEEKPMLVDPTTGVGMELSKSHITSLLMRVEGSKPAEAEEDAKAETKVADADKRNDEIRAPSASRNAKLMIRKESKAGQGGSNNNAHHSSQNDLPPPRRGHGDAKRDRDLSPPRRRGRIEESDSDISPPRRGHGDAKRDRDFSPPRRGHGDVKRDRDLSPPRRGHGDAKRDRDLAPPRRGHGDAKRDRDLSPPRRRGRIEESDSDISPPRRGHGDAKRDRDLSPPRRGHGDAKRDRDLSPPRRGHGDVKKEGDLSPQREQTAEGAPTSELLESFNALGTVREGEANIIYRDKEGKRISKEEWLKLEEKRRKHRQKRQYERQELEWGTGLEQKRQKDISKEEEAEISAAPLARYEIDPKYDDTLRKQNRWGDPLANITNEEASSTTKKAESARPKCRFPAPPNRFGILPGYKWDGVIRGVGFEEKRMEAIHKKKQQNIMAHMWNVADM